MISVQSPSKINLSLAITGRRSDGYHLLSSHVVFADLCDDLYLTPNDLGRPTLKVTGEFSSFLSGDIRNNIIIRGLYAVAYKANQSVGFDIHLVKNTPIGAGLGGGSSNAAMVVKTLIDYWKVDIHKDALQDLLLKLGADVPVCYYGLPCMMEGIGEDISPLPILGADIPALIIYPRCVLSTPKIFQAGGFDFRKNTPYVPTIFKGIKNIQQWKEVISSYCNDLTHNAIKQEPEIQMALDILSRFDECFFYRMSGSGSACFGLFENSQARDHASTEIEKQYSEWFIAPANIAI